MFDQLPQSLRLDLVLRLLLVLLTLGLAVLLRNFVAWLLASPLKRLLVHGNKDGLNESISQLVLPPTRYLLLAPAIEISARLLQVGPDLNDFLTHVTRTLVIVSLALLISPLVGLFVSSRRRLYTLSGILLDEALIPFLKTGMQLFVWAIVLVIIIQVWGYDVTGLIAGLGIGGLAISLAAQDTLSNLFGFAAIVSDRPFVVGEYIKTPDVEGSIERVGLRSTRVRQGNQAVVTVPNSRLAAAVVLNWSRLAKRQMDLSIGLSYQTRSDTPEVFVREARSLLASSQYVDAQSVTVFFTGFGPPALNVMLRCYLNIADWTAFTAEQERILLDVLRLAERLELQTAFATQTVSIDNFNGSPAPAALREEIAQDRPAQLTHPKDRG